MFSGGARASSAVLAVVTGACGAPHAAERTPPGASPRACDAAAIEPLLDDWHRAAAESDLEAYFAPMAEDFVFLGTDEEERWDREAFRVYATGPFAEGRGWSMTSRRRALAREGPIAWFDEDLETKNLGPARGSGVLRCSADGTWALTQYVLSITVPNARFSDVRALLAGDVAEAAPPLAPPG